MTFAPGCSPPRRLQASEPTRSAFSLLALSFNRLDPKSLTPWVGSSPSSPQRCL